MRQEQHIDALVNSSIATLGDLASSLEQASEALSQRVAEPLGNGRAQRMQDHAAMLKAYRDSLLALRQEQVLEQRHQS